MTKVENEARRSVPRKRAIKKAAAPDSKKTKKYHQSPSRGGGMFQNDGRQANRFIEAVECSRMTDAGLIGLLATVRILNK